MSSWMTRGRAAVLAAIFAAGGIAELGTAGPATAEQQNAGAYLAARQAARENDFETAAIFFEQALALDPDNPFLLENTIASFVTIRAFDRAAPVAQQTVATGLQSQVAHMVQMARAARQDDWRAIFDALESGRTVGPLVDGLAQGWAFVGLGQMDRALASFDQVAETPGLRAFGLYHKALALASVGDLEGADALFSLGPEAGMQRTRRSTIAHAQVLSQLGRNAEAVDRIDRVFGSGLDAGLSDLRARLVAGGPVGFTFVPDPAAGLSEVFFSVAGAIETETADSYTLLYSRIAEYLDATNIEALLLSARALERLGRYDLANATYDRVPPDHPTYQAAELGRADALRQAGRLDTAVEVLTQLRESHGDLPVIQSTLGDVLRRMGRTREANEAYTAALDLSQEGAEGLWRVHYTRGITYETLGEWDAAEADFRRALSLNPDQPQVLNYLGYSLLEQGVRYDEALGMIEAAAAAQPDSGAIIDSLGWGLYLIGRHAEAVGHLERAAELDPTDATINDHLGDGYWSVGRETEARFQWTRALSFDPDGETGDRIRRKLQYGLDLVLAEEGDDPIKMANDDSH